MNALWLALAMCLPQVDSDATSTYQSRDVEGFSVLVNPRVLEHEAEATEAIAELKKQLAAITRVVPVKPLTDLRRVRIWMEWNARPGGAAEFHRSAEWLKGNGYNPEKAGSVEIGNARNFVAWSRDNQPWMILHELAHAYHHRVLGPDHAGLAAAYKSAVAGGRYESVAYGQRGKRKAYALTDSYEYFSELSEAYFGRNDFEPVNRADLEAFDPAGSKLMREVWGEPLGSAPPNPTIKLR
jgi:hypothetical protein